MMTLNFYAVMQKETSVLLQFLTSSDDKEASKFLVDMILSSYDSVPDDEKDKYIKHVHNCSIVRVGSCDLISHELINDFNVLLDLKDLDFKEVKKDNGNAS